MIENRKWTHNESPLGLATAATYREGCRCWDCTEANRVYMAAYRARRVHQNENLDGTTVYHSHSGQPSKRTARKWLCIHPRCLDMAGLMLLNGAVVDKTTCIVDATFGAVLAAKAVA